MEVEMQELPQPRAKRPSLVVGGSGTGFAGLAVPSKLQKAASSKQSATSEPSLSPLVLVSAIICVGALALICASLASSWYLPRYRSYGAASNFTSSTSPNRHCVVVDFQSWRQARSLCQDCTFCSGSQRHYWRKSCAFQNDGISPHRCANQASMYNLVLGLLVVAVGLLLAAAVLTSFDAFKRLPKWGGRTPFLLFFLHVAALAFCIAAWAVFVAQVTKVMREDGGAVCKGKESPCASLRGCTRVGPEGEELPYRACWGPGGGLLLAVVGSTLQVGAVALLLAGKLQSTVRQVVQEAGRADDLEQLQQLVLQDGVQLTTEAIVEQEARLRREHFQGSPDAEIEPDTARVFAAALETQYERTAAQETARLAAAEEGLVRARRQGSAPPAPSAVPLLPLPQSPVPQQRFLAPTASAVAMERVRASSQPPKMGVTVEPKAVRYEAPARQRERSGSSSTLPDRQASLRSALRSSRTASPARVKFSPPNTSPAQAGTPPFVSPSVSGGLGEAVNRQPRSALATAPPTSTTDLLPDEEEDEPGSTELVEQLERAALRRSASPQPGDLEA